MLSGRGLCDELITRPEESYRLWCVVVCDLETSRMDAPYIYMTLVAYGLISIFFGRKQISFAVLSRGPYKNVHKRITRSHICDILLFPKIGSS